MKDSKGHGSNKRGTHAQGVNKIGVAPKVHPKVIEKIRKSPDGISITPAGTQPKVGYMVSIPGHTKIVHASDIHGPNGHNILSSYAQQHSSALSVPGAHIGSWTDKESGKTYLDVSHNIRGKSAAIKAGKKNNQIAIWDLRHSREIKTGGTGA